MITSCDKNQDGLVEIVLDLSSEYVPDIAKFMIFTVQVEYTDSQGTANSESGALTSTKTIDVKVEFEEADETEDEGTVSDEVEGEDLTHGVTLAMAIEDAISQFG